MITPIELLCDHLAVDRFLRARWNYFELCHLRRGKASHDTRPDPPKLVNTPHDAEAAFVHETRRSYLRHRDYLSCHFLRLRGTLNSTICGGPWTSMEHYLPIIGTISMYQPNLLESFLRDSSLASSCSNIRHSCSATSLLSPFECMCLHIYESLLSKVNYLVHLK